MIDIYVNGSRVFLKAGSSFEFIRENNLFDSSDGYSFEMEFPLKDCPENAAAFNYLNIPAIDKPAGLLPCNIRCGDFSLKGSVAVMSADRHSVKCQFLEGVDSDESQYRLENTFINELDLGRYPEWDPKKVSPSVRFDERGGYFPWSSKEYEVVNNKTVFSQSVNVNSVRWDDEVDYITWQPYLKDILFKVVEAVGYSFSDRAGFLNLIADKADALVCNTLPFSWKRPEFAEALPAWSVIEFFEKLGLFYGGRFSWDHVAHSISFSSFERAQAAAGVVVLESVDEEYSAAISRDEADAEFLPLKKFRYAADDSDIWKLWDCPEYLNGIIKNYPGFIKSYDSWNDALPEIKAMTPYSRYLNGRGTLAASVIYIRDIDLYFLMRANFCEASVFYPQGQKPLHEFALFAQMTPLNVFGPPLDSFDENNSYEDLDIVPVTVDWCNGGQMMILPVGSLDNDDKSLPDHDVDSRYNFLNVLDTQINVSDDPVFYQSRWVQRCENKEKASTAFFDKLYIGFPQPPLNECCRCTNQSAPAPDINIWLSYMDEGVMGKMRLDRLGIKKIIGGNIDPKVMYEFSFISSYLPNINAVFVIAGRKFVCKKLTAKFSDKGISKVIKGEFYRIVD